MFAGPRVIEQTIGEKLPDGFRKSECTIMVWTDMVTSRDKIRDELILFITYL